MNKFTQSGLMMSRQLHFMEGEAFSQLLTAIGSLWRGDIKQGLLLAEHTLGIFQEAGILWGMYRSYTTIAFFMQTQGDHEKTERAYESALALSRQAGDLNMTTFLLFSLGRIALEQEQHQRAQSLFQESLTLARQAKNKHMISGNLQALGRLYIRLKEYEQAREWLAECIAIQKDTGDQEIVFSLNRLGYVARLEGDYEQAQNYYAEGLRLAQKYNSRQLLAWCLAGLAELAALSNQSKKAAQLLGAADTISEFRINLWSHERLELEQIANTIQNQLHIESLANTYVTGKQMNIDEAVAYALKGLGQ